ncbi:MAG TPA: rhodanese-like domain-containing protein, partial [Gaiellaceae bacterium]|nr:rhodanese-like domain-containing protein [Gaiellaceae bacterium]
VDAREGAAGLFASLRRLLELSDGVEVFPGHVAGSLCGRAMSSKASSTIGFERRFNPALRLDDERAFVADGGRLGDGPESIDPVRLDELEEVLAGGAELLDVRERDERDGGYIAGSRNVPYRLLALADADVPVSGPVVTICETGPRAAIAASLLAAKGVDARPVVGGGMREWAAQGGRTVEFRRCGG